MGKMYKCNECGNLFEEGEQVVWQEDRGECFGFPSYETMDGCPLCSGDYEEVEPCKICGSYESIKDGEEFCKDCLAYVIRRYRKVLNENFDENELAAIEFLREECEI